MGDFVVNPAISEGFPKGFLKVGLTRRLASKASLHAPERLIIQGGTT